MIEANKKIFSGLKEWVTERGIELSDKTQNSDYYIPSDTESKKWLKNGTLEKHLSILGQYQAAEFKLETERLICIIGFDSMELDPEHFSQISFSHETNNKSSKQPGGLLTLAITELNLIPKSSTTPYSILENILVDPQDDKAIEINTLELVKLYPKILFFHTIEKSPLHEATLDRILCQLVINTPYYTPLPLTDEAKKQATKLILEGCESYPFLSLLQALLSIRWEYAYLEVYRTLERLFAIPQTIELKTILKIDCDTLFLVSAVENNTGWRAKEEESVCRLLNFVTPQTQDFVNEIINTINNNKESNSNAGKKIYSIRNSIVHFRASQDALSYSNQVWSDLISSLMMIAYDLYHKFSEHLPPPN